MTHMTLTVALPGTLTQEEIPDALAAALERYYEERETARYVAYTKAQLIEKSRAEIQEYAETTYADYVADPAGYRVKRSRASDQHFAYLAGTNADGGFPAKLEWTDDQHYEDAVRWEEPEDIGPEGEIYSTRNPDAKWDWYVIGGRWSGYWIVHPDGGEAKDLSAPAWRDRPFGLGDADREYVQKMEARSGVRVDVARKMDIDFDNPDINNGHLETFAFLDSSAQWHEKAERWSEDPDGAVQAAWKARYLDLIAAEAENAWLVMVDYHI